MQVDAAWCGQFAKSERLWAMSTHPVRSVIFVYLNSCKRFTLESSTRNAGGNLFGTVSSVSCAKGPSGSRTQTKPFAICVFCLSRKWKKEVRAQAAQAFQTEPAEHTRYERCVPCARPWIIFVLHPGRGRFANWPHFKTQRSQDVVMMNNSWNFRVGLWILQLQVLPRTLASSHPTLQNKSATQNLQDCPFECFGASRIVSLWFFNSAGQSSLAAFGEYMIRPWLKLQDVFLLE